MGRLDGQVAVITGGARGQGRSHAVALAQEGADIVLCDLADQLDGVPYALGTADELEESVRLVEQTGRRAISHQADVRDPAAMERVAASAIAEFGRIDILCANAGIAVAGQLHELTPEKWSMVIDTDLNGVYWSMRAVIPQMIEQSSGRIIATSSGLGRMGMQNMGAYVAAKWGVIGLVKTAAIELGPYNVTVNAICPGNADTPMFVNDMMKDLFLGGREGSWADVDEFIIAAGIHKLPVPRISPEDISRTVVFLASEDARLISGSTVDVSAGAAAGVTA